MTPSCRTWCAAAAITLGCGGEVTSRDVPRANGGMPAPDGVTGGDRAEGGGSGIGAAPATGGAGVTGGSATGGAAGACVAASTVAVPVPSVLELVIDASESMGEAAYPGTDNPATKWQELLRVLPAAMSLLPSSWAAGATFISTAETGCYVGQQAVPIAELTAAQLGSIEAAAAVRVPYGQRPTLAAWRHGLGELTAWAAPPEYAASPRYLVLITDGSPTVNGDGCTVAIPITETEYDAEIAAVANEGLTAGVETFVVGLPGSADPLGASYDPLYKLSEWAVAGGTPEPAGCVPAPGAPSGNLVDPRGTYCHLDLTTGADFATAFTQALGTIPSQARSCTFAVPSPSSHWPDITLTYTPGSGIPRVLTRTSENCTDGQWYVMATDSLGFPTVIRLCPNACSFFVGDPGAAIQITLACFMTP